MLHLVKVSIVNKISTLLLVLFFPLFLTAQTENPDIQQNKDQLLAGIFKAVAYSGFRTGQHPDRGNGAKNPSDADILEDLQILSRDSNFKLIRLYDSQENSETVLKLIKENDINIKVMLGAWLEAEISNHEGCPWLNSPIPQEKLNENKIKNHREIDRAIRLSNEYKDIVVAVNVGNEALVSWNDHMVTIDSVIAYVRKVKKSIPQKVTVADNYDWWARHGTDLASELDFIGVHTYPAWEGKTVEEAMPYMISNIEAVKRTLPHATIVIAEAGWATVASEFGERASETNQLRYYNDLISWAEKMHITTFFFEAFDEDWKGDPNNPLGAEKHWGLFTVDRKAKKVMHDLYPDLVP
ncbi:MAG: glycosyl hydrolase [Calditrichae bacterium]|nr:glycosyl hydrolase [Calditrichota bacterium]MCB9058324.1 glycosyl hydrolase [Calditrichia bacterium]